MRYEDDDLMRPSAWKSVSWMVVAAFLTIFIWQIPFGHLLLYPFSILSTWFHEMGHGLTALLLGGNFNALKMYPDGSGLAMHQTSGNLKLALVAAGGLLGPPIAGSLFIVSGGAERSSRRVLYILGATLLFSLIWIRSWFGFVAVPLLGASLFAIARKGPDWLQPVVVQFLGVQACISSFQQLNYLFMPSAYVGGQVRHSDTGHIAQVLLLPYWVWGCLIALISFGLLMGSMWLVVKQHRREYAQKT